MVNPINVMILSGTVEKLTIPSIAYINNFTSDNIESFFKMLDKITNQTKNKKEKN